MNFNKVSFFQEIHGKCFDKKNNSIQFHFSFDTFTINVAIVSLPKKISTWESFQILFYKPGEKVT